MSYIDRSMRDYRDVCNFNESVIYIRIVGLPFFAE